VAPEDVRAIGQTARASGPVITGTIQPEKRADLRAEISAVVVQVLKDNGEAVRQGELLVRLDDAAIRDNMTSANEAVRASSQSLEQAERTLQRQKTLQAQGMTSMAALEDAELRRNSAQSDLVAARARVATARQQLSRTEVRAPFAGVVSERKTSVGDTAQVGRELLKVIDPKSLRLDGLVAADRIGELRVGQPVRFRVNGYPDTEFAGRLKRLDLTANAATRQIAVQVEITGGEMPKVAGLYAEGRIETGATQVISVPETDLVRAGDNAHAWRVAGSALQKVPLKLGERDARNGEVVVLSGLAAGDRILRRPSGTLVDGQSFEWTKPASAAPVPSGAPAPAPSGASAPAPSGASAPADAAKASASAAAVTNK
jgi:RND family efflux transporter MFP subunit